MNDKNISFEEKLSKIKTQCLSKNDHQKQIATVLLAVENTLHNENAEGKSLQNTDNKNLLYPILYLLNLTIPFTNKPLLRSKFDQISTTLSAVLTQPEINTSILRLIINCLQNFLIIQDNSIWTDPKNNIKQTFSCLLILGLDPRPKARKKAHKAIGEILSNPPPNPSTMHPILDFVSKEALYIAKKTVLENKEDIKYKNKITFDHSKAIHAFQLIKVIADSDGWPPSRIEPLCDILIEVSKTKDYYLIMTAFEVFQIIFKKSDFVSEELRNILDSIIKKKPSEKDIILLPPWFSALITGFESYFKLEQNLAFELLQQIFMDIFPFLQSDSLEIRTSCNEVLLRLITNCIPSWIEKDNRVIVKLIELTMQGFTLNYRIAWKEIFKILIAFFENLPFYIDPYFINALKLVDEMRVKNNFDGKLEADQVVGAAIKAVGPKTILKILPLNLGLEDKKSPTRTWMLAILRSNIYNTELQHFISEFIPLSEQLYQKIIENKNSVQEKTFVELLITILYNQTDLRPIICQALQILINKNKEVIDNNDNNKFKLPITESSAENNLIYLQKFAPNILSTLFNIYGQTLSQFREYILICIKSWLSEIENIFDRVVELLSQSLKEKPKINSHKENPNSVSHAILDLLIVMTVHLPPNKSLPLYNIINFQILNETDHILQKKAYNLFCKMAENPSIKEFLKDNIQEVQKIFLENASKTETSIKKYRFSALFHIINILPLTDLHFIPLILSEIIMGTKDSNKKARSMAYNLLISIGNKMSESSIVENTKISKMDTVSNIKVNIQEFFTMILAGLAGSSPHMISATIISITRLLFEFKDSLDQNFINELLNTVYMFIISNNYEIVKSTLGFIKMTLICLPISIMKNYLSMLIPNLIIWAHEHKGHFRAKVKNIIERIIRRYGFEIVEKEVPEQDKKLIINIKKTKERLKRKKIAKENKLKNSTLNNKHNILNKDKKIYKNEDTDSDISISTDVSDFKNKKISEKQQALIKKIDDELIDLLDTNSLIQVVKNNSKKSKKSRQKTHIIPQFKIDDNGKIIIEDVKESNLKKSSKSSDDNFNAYISSIKNKDGFSRGYSNKIRFNKRKKESDDDSSDSENTPGNKQLNNQSTKNIQKSKHTKNKQKIIKFK
ncbi:hypothetical protein PMAC_000520 [Pneumocystis sp. 'macacae']|nr:hypothetical protein PMAC_000520 [Pneumocystis sp. 'macacae']